MCSPAPRTPDTKRRLMEAIDRCKKRAARLQAFYDSLPEYMGDDAEEGLNILLENFDRRQP